MQQSWRTTSLLGFLATILTKGVQEDCLNLWQEDRKSNCSDSAQAFLIETLCLNLILNLYFMGSCISPLQSHCLLFDLRELC